MVRTIAHPLALLSPMAGEPDAWDTPDTAVAERPSRWRSTAGWPRLPWGAFDLTDGEPTSEPHPLAPALPRDRDSRAAPTRRLPPHGAGARESAAPRNLAGDDSLAVQPDSFAAAQLGAPDYGASAAPASALERHDLPGEHETHDFSDLGRMLEHLRHRRPEAQATQPASTWLDDVRQSVHRDRRDRDAHVATPDPDRHGSQPAAGTDVRTSSDRRRAAEAENLASIAEDIAGAASKADVARLEAMLGTVLQRLDAIERPTSPPRERATVVATCHEPTRSQTTFAAYHAARAASRTRIAEPGDGTAAVAAQPAPVQPEPRRLAPPRGTPPQSAAAAVRTAGEASRDTGPRTASAEARSPGRPSTPRRLWD